MLNSIFLYPNRYKIKYKYYICTQRGIKLVEMEYSLLSQYVKQMRKEHSLTQVELSEKSGVGLRFVRELEQGKKTLRLDKVNQILILFGAELAPVPVTKTDE